MRTALVAVPAVLAAAVPALARAQRADVVGRPAVSVGGGVFQYDLSGTGTVPMLAARVELPLARYALVEGGVVAARPERQSAGRETFVAPEAQLQLQLPLGRFAPYLGAGAGAALRSGGGRTDSDLTVSGAGGVRAWLTDRTGLRGELRVRGIGTRFTGSAAEWTLGVSRRF
jgi:hypothetical protein